MDHPQPPRGAIVRAYGALWRRGARHWTSPPGPRGPHRHMPWWQLTAAHDLDLDPEGG